MTQTTSPAPTPSSAFRQRFRDLGSLRRSTDKRAVAGVAEGLSRHFDIDPIIVRVLFAALTFFGGAGLILYLALWLTVPVETSPHSILSRRLNRDPHAWTTIGLALGGILAAMALLGSLSWATPHPFPFLLFALVVGLGLLALTRRGDRPLPMPSTTDPAYSSAASAPAAPAPSEDQDQLPGNALAQATAAEPASLDSEVNREPRAWWQRDNAPPSGATVPPFMLPAPPPPRRPPSHLFGLTVALIALAEAAVWVVDATSSYDVNPSVYPGLALGTIAVALLVGAWWGRSRGLIAIGVLASILTAGAAFAGPGPYGERSASPGSASELRSSYPMGIGRFSLHLEQIADIETINGREVVVDQHIGMVDIIIPSSVRAVVIATVEHGEIDGPAGVRDLDNRGEYVEMTPAAAGQPTLTIHAHLDYGLIRIERAACPGDGLPAAGESTWSWKGDTHVAAACN